MNSHAPVFGSNGLSLGSMQAANKLLADYKLTPATLASKLENRHVLPGQRLRFIAKQMHLYISMQVARAIAAGNGRIIISAPPRHGKSRIGTIHTPIWTLEHFPHFNVVVTTYGQELSSDFNRDIRELIKQNQDLLSIRIKADSNRVLKFQVEGGGAMTAIGLGGPITGRGANVLIIDDYIKTIKEAESKSYRDETWNWFTTTAMTRLEPDASVIVTATRWNDDDMIGRILKQFPGEWTNICIPAIAEENDVLGREIGEALFPERYSVKALEKRRELLGTKYFDAIFQQHPHPDDSKLTDKSWIQIVDRLPDFKVTQLRFIRVWDLAATQGGGDYTVGALMCLDKENRDIYLLDIKRVQLSPGRVESLVQTVAEDDGYGVEVIIEQEPGSSGKSLVNHYKTDVLKDFRCTGYPVNKEKVLRATPLLAATEMGKFKLLRAKWNQPWIDEFEEFGPDCENDDQIDPCAIGYDVLLGKRRKAGTFGRYETGSSPTASKSLLESAAENAQNGFKVAVSENGIRKADGIIMPKKASFQVKSRATFGR